MHTMRRVFVGRDQLQLEDFPVLRAGQQSYGQEPVLLELVAFYYRAATAVDHF
jgi:hypothetical protein